MFDLGPASDDLVRLVRGVRDDQLGGPTPCADWSLADLLVHVHQFATVFTANARKVPPTPVDGLPGDWRAALPLGLAELARAWRDESAWQGRVSAGGVEMSGEENAVVAIEELVVHGWDVARASGQDYTCDEPSLEAVHGFVSQFSGPGQEEARTGLFGPEVAVREGAPLLDRVIAMTGRRPASSPG